MCIYNLISFNNVLLQMLRYLLTIEIFVRVAYPAQVNPSGMHLICIFKFEEIS